MHNSSASTEWITVLALMILLFHSLVQQYTLQGAVIKKTGKQHLQHLHPQLVTDEYWTVLDKGDS